MSSSPAPERRPPRWLILALLAGSGAARGEAPAEEASREAATAPAVEAESVEADDPDATITVWGEAEIARRRAALERDLLQNGYEPGRRKGDRTVYRARQAWKPSVVVYDDGFVVLRRGPVRFGVPEGVNPWWNLLCPLALPMCVRVGGQIVSKRKLDPVKGKVLAETRPELQAWQDAIVARAMQERLDEEVPSMLDAVWHEGRSPEDGRFLPTPAERRKAILDFWAGRACNPEGQAVRDVVELYLSEEVQGSEAPLRPDEIAAAEAANPCGDRLDL